jgi:hypothetical protein
MRIVLSMVAAFVIMTFVSVVFAGDSGIVGDSIIAALGKLIKDQTVVAGIYGAIVWLLVIGIRFALAKIPGGADGPLASVLWKIASWLFGKEVVMSNNTDTEYIKKQLIKDYPLLQIDIKKLTDK